MKVTGFTIVRNAIKFDYPIVEAITSILPICDEFVVAVGNSDDGTRDFIESIPSDKIRIIDTTWDDNLREGGRVLADETNKAYAAISDDTDWAFYIQGDEVVHERYLDIIREGMEAHKDNLQVDGLLFNYEHFYGSYDYVGDSTDWYRREIRIVRKNDQIYSYRDAQGFRKGDDEKLKVKHIDAYVYHYGWVKPPETMMAKNVNLSKMFKSDEEIEKQFKTSEFDYSQINALRIFETSHPKVMQDRITRVNWKFDHDVSIKKYNLKEKFKRFVEQLTGYRLWEYRNYIRI